MPDDTFWRNYLALDQIVRHVEQAAQKILITGDTFFEISLAVAGGRGHFQHEAPFGADRHDNRIFHHLRFDQA